MDVLTTLPVLGTTAMQAAWLMIAAVPISIYVAWADMKTMKIPTPAVYALVAGFAVLGLIALPFADYLWRWSHLVVVLGVGILLNLIRLVGAGDAKFAAAAAPFIAYSDWRLMIAVYAVCFLAAYGVHRIAKHTPIRRLAPDWASWTTGKRFPMGFALGVTLVGYLALAVLRG